MIQTVKAKTIVKPGGFIELHSDELPEGASVEVIVLVEDAEGEGTEGTKKFPKRNLVDLIGSAKGLFSSVEEIDAFVREERDSWER